MLQMRNENNKPHCKGFTLIELIIVIAIMGILVGILVPAFKSSVRKANEAAAVGTLSAIRVAEAKYVVDHKGQYGSFQQLFEQGYLDKRMNYGQPHDHGYVFVLHNRFHCLLSVSICSFVFRVSLVLHIVG